MKICGINSYLWQPILLDCARSDKTPLSVRAQSRTLTITLLTCLFFSQYLFAQPDSVYLIKVHFLYGSKPKRQFKATEPKYFGGLHGGHVSMEIGEEIVGFGPANSFHIFSHRKNRHSTYDKRKLTDWAKDTATAKYTSIEILLNKEQYQKLKEVTGAYLSSTPYDYAFFGMRCACAARDVLGKSGILKERSRFTMILFNFYPRPFRRKLLRKARKAHYTIHRQAGRKSRKWEMD